MHKQTVENPAHVLTVEQFTNSPTALREELVAAGALRFRTYKSGLFPASDLPKEFGDATGMNMAWLRDNAHVAAALEETGDAEHLELAVGVGKAMLTVLQNNEDILSDVARGKNLERRLPVRVNGDDLANDTDGRNQNDSTGYALWLTSRLLAKRRLSPTPDNLGIIAQTVRYLNKIEYWQDADDGHWEEDSRVQAASIGVIVAGLRAAQQMFAARQMHTNLPFKEMIDKGMSALRSMLAQGVTDLPPKGSMPSRKPELADEERGGFLDSFSIERRQFDAAMLFLVQPLGALKGAEAAKIVADIKQNLQRDHGVARYIGDTYWSPHFPTILSVRERTATDKNLIAARNQRAAGIAYTNTEAQWTLFDPLLSEEFGQRYLKTESTDDLADQRLHLNRMLAQLVPAADGLRFPEAFYYDNIDGVDQWTPNPHNPLLWTQANALRALKMFERTHAKK